MSDIICVTNRKLCREDFFERIEKIAAEKPKAIILREKDLNEEEYRTLADHVMEICKKYGTECILHTFYRTAAQLKADAIHLSLPSFRGMNEIERGRFKKIGVSCHSVSDALEAEKCGCTYITAGHVFATDCKRGLPPRGIEFLSEVCGAVNIPVYAIGGIDASNIASVRAAGAYGGCVMSGFMKCDDVKIFTEAFENEQRTIDIVCHNGQL